MRGAAVGGEVLEDEGSGAYEAVEEPGSNRSNGRAEGGEVDSAKTRGEGKV